MSIGTFPYSASIVVHANASKLSFEKTDETDPSAPPHPPPKPLKTGHASLVVPLDYALFTGSSCLANAEQNVKCDFFPYYTTDRAGKTARAQRVGDFPKTTEYTHVNFAVFEELQRKERAALGAGGVCATTEHSLVELKRVTVSSKHASGMYRFSIRMRSIPWNTSAMSDENWKIFAVFDVRVIGYVETVYRWSGEDFTLQAPMGVAGVYKCRWITRKIAARENAEVALAALNAKRTRLAHAIRKGELSPDMYFVENASPARSRAICLALVGYRMNHDGSLVGVDPSHTTKYHENLVDKGLPSWAAVSEVLTTKGFSRRDFFHLVMEFCGANRPVSMAKYAVECEFLGRWKRSELWYADKDEDFDLVVHGASEEDSGTYALEALENGLDGMDRWTTLCVYRVVVMPTPSQNSLPVSATGVKISMDARTLIQLRQPVAVKWVYTRSHTQAHKDQLPLCLEDSHSSATGGSGPVAGCEGVHRITSTTFPQRIVSGGAHLVIHPVVPQVSGTYLAIVKTARARAGEHDELWDARSVTWDGVRLDAASVATSTDYNGAKAGIVAAILLAHVADGLEQNPNELLGSYTGLYAEAVLPYLTAAVEDRTNNALEYPTYFRDSAGKPISPMDIPDDMLVLSLSTVPLARIVNGLQQYTAGLKEIVKSHGIGVLWNYGRHVALVRSGSASINVDINVDKLVQTIARIGSVLASEKDAMARYEKMATRIYLTAQNARDWKLDAKENVWTDPFMLVDPVRVAFVRSLHVRDVFQDSVECGDALVLDGKQFLFDRASFPALEEVASMWRAPRPPAYGVSGIISGDTLEIRRVTERDSGVYTLHVDLFLNFLNATQPFGFEVYYDIDVKPKYTAEEKWAMVQRVLNDPRRYMAAMAFLHHVRMNTDIATLPYTLQVASAYSRSAVYPDARLYTRDLWDIYNAWCEARASLPGVESSVNLETRDAIRYGLVIQASAVSIRPQTVGAVTGDPDLFYHFSLCLAADEDAQKCNDEAEVDFRSLLKDSVGDAYRVLMTDMPATALFRKLASRANKDRSPPPPLLSSKDKDKDKDRVDKKSMTPEQVFDDFVDNALCVTRHVTTTMCKNADPVILRLASAAFQMVSKMRHLEAALRDAQFTSHPLGWPNRDEELDKLRQETLDARKAGKSMDHGLELMQRVCSVGPQKTGQYDYGKLVRSLSCEHLGALRFAPTDRDAEFWDKFWIVKKFVPKDGLELYTNIPHVHNLRHFPNVDLVEDPRDDCTTPKNPANTTKIVSPPALPSPPPPSPPDASGGEPHIGPKAKKKEEIEGPESITASKPGPFTPNITQTPININPPPPAITTPPTTPPTTPTQTPTQTSTTKTTTDTSQNDTLEGKAKLTVPEAEAAENALNEQVDTPRLEAEAPSTPKTGTTALIGVEVGTSKASGTQAVPSKLKENSFTIRAAMRGNHNTAVLAVDVTRFDAVANRAITIRREIAEAESSKKSELAEKEKEKEEARMRTVVTTEYQQYLNHLEAQERLTSGDKIVNFLETPGYLGYTHKKLHRKLDYCLDKCVEHETCTPWRHRLDTHKIWYTSIVSALRCTKTLKFRRVGQASFFLFSLYGSAWNAVASRLNDVESFARSLQDALRQTWGPSAGDTLARLDEWERTLTTLEQMYVSLNAISTRLLELRQEVPESITKWLEQIHHTANTLLPEDSTAPVVEALSTVVKQLPKVMENLYALTFQADPEGQRALGEALAKNSEAAATARAKLERMQAGGGFRPEAVQTKLENVEALEAEFKKDPLALIEEDLREKLAIGDSAPSLDSLTPGVAGLVDRVSPYVVHPIIAELLKSKVPDYETEPLVSLTLDANAKLEDMQKETNPAIQFANAQEPDLIRLKEEQASHPAGVCVSLDLEYALAGTPEHEQLRSSCRKSEYKVCYDVSDLFVLLGCKQHAPSSASTAGSLYVKLQSDAETRRRYLDVYRSAFGENNSIGDLVQYMSALFGTRFVTFTYRKGIRVDTVLRTKNRSAAISLFALAQHADDAKDGSNVAMTALKVIRALLTDKHTKILLRLNDVVANEWDVATVTKSADASTSTSSGGKRMWVLYSKEKALTEEDLLNDVAQKLATTRYDVSIEMPERETILDTRFPELKAESNDLKRKLADARERLSTELAALSASKGVK